MADSVILLVGSEGYLPHAKALFVNCVLQGEWKGDFCFMCDSSCDTSSIENRNIAIHKTEETSWTNAIKFRIFSQHFSTWNYLLYLDCDILIQGDLNHCCEQMQPRLPKILCDSSSQASILDDWKHFGKLAGAEPESHPEAYQRLRERFPHIDSPILASSTMFFSPGDIPENAVDDLFAVQADFVDINPGCYDQQVMNLTLYDRMEAMTKYRCSWFAFDDPGNRVACPERHWLGDENPEIIHYWGMYAPWIVKTPDAGAAHNHRLDRVCHELYAENLEAFERIFPHV